jgi:predicted nuclease with TOPRIM domain
MPDDIPPALVLSTPSEGFTIEEPIATVSGTTEPGVDLVVNGLLVSVANNGSFSCVIPLKEGQNEILITATDASGNPTVVMRNVTYDDPLPQVMDRIDSLEASLGSAMEDMASLEDRIATVEMDLMGSGEDISSLEGSLSELRADLNSTLANLTSIQEALVTLEDDLIASGYDIEEIEDALSELRDDINDTGEGLEDIQGRLDLLEGQVDERMGSVQDDNDDLRSGFNEMRTITTLLIASVVALFVFSLFLLIISVAALVKRRSGTKSSPMGSEE